MIVPLERPSSLSGKRLRIPMNISTIQKEQMVDVLGMDFDAIRNEAKDKYNLLEAQGDVEMPSEDAFVNAYVGYKGLNPKNKNYLTVVDFYPNNKSGGLFYIINMESNTVEYSNNVGHGKGSRGEYDSPSGFPDSYGNEVGSKQSSLGFFRTSENLRPGLLNIREGLKLEGVEEGINNNAGKRALCVHPAGLDQSEGCFTLPYDKSEGQAGEDKILMQLMKIRGSILFAYDSRVFEKYAKQSKFFLGVEESVDGGGSYFVDGNRENEIRERIIRNQGGDKVSLFQRGMDFVGRRIFESRYEKEKEKDRECWWKKKEIEKIAAQIGKEVKKRMEKENLQDLYDNIYRVWIRFKEDFYKSKAKHRRENIDVWVSEFWDIIIGLFREKDLTDLIKMCDDKKFEYEAWEKESSKNNRKIPGEEYAERRLAS